MVIPAHGLKMEKVKKRKRKRKKETTRMGGGWLGEGTDSWIRPR